MTVIKNARAVECELRGAGESEFECWVFDATNATDYSKAKHLKGITHLETGASNTSYERARVPNLKEPRVVTKRSFGKGIDCYHGALDDKFILLCDVEKKIREKKESF